jgi:protein-tyrosine phosphatase
MQDIRVESAGVRALVGQPADPNAQEVAMEHDLDLSTHVARQIDGQIIRQHELILVMEAHQELWIVQQFPQARGRVYLMGHWAAKSEVPDPYRLTTDAFREAYRLINEYATQWRSHIV